MHRDESMLCYLFEVIHCSHILQIHISPVWFIREDEISEVHFAYIVSVNDNIDK